MSARGARRSLTLSRTRSSVFCRPTPDPGKRIRELIEALGYEGGKTILDDYLREVRRSTSAGAPTSARSTGPASFAVRPLRAASRDPGRLGQTRRGYVLTAVLGYSRALAGALVFSKEAPDLIYGMNRCLAAWAGCPRRSSGTARARSTPAAASRPMPSPASAASCRFGG